MKILIIWKYNTTSMSWGSSWAVAWCKNLICIYIKWSWTGMVVWNTQNTLKWWRRMIGCISWFLYVGKLPNKQPLDLDIWNYLCDMLCKAPNLITWAIHAHWHLLCIIFWGFLYQGLYPINFRCLFFERRLDL